MSNLVERVHYHRFNSQLLRMYIGLRHIRRTYINTVSNLIYNITYNNNGTGSNVLS